MELEDCFIKMLLALICGGILGFDRGRKKRPAGFRTYMLVCMGAALVMMTNEYICRIYGTGDPSRMGAQVISGIGFLGAGTIIVTGHNRVKGLTTAAGLWAAACVGLAIGVGYYPAAILGTVMILIAMASLHDLDDRVMASSLLMNLYIELSKPGDLKKLLACMRDNGIKIIEMEIEHSDKVHSKASTAVLISLRLNKKQPSEDILQLLTDVEGVKYVEEL